MFVWNTHTPWMCWKEKKMLRRNAFRALAQSVVFWQIQLDHPKLSATFEWLLFVAVYFQAAETAKSNQVNISLASDKLYLSN